MPRKARITIPGAVHHVMSRGLDGRPIFRDDGDRTFFLRILEQCVARSGHLVYAWALMDNHFHLVIRTSDYPLASLMRSVNGQYAQFFRRAAESRGYLFQDRYKSIVTQDQNYVEELVRYVHLNPLRAGVCSDMASLDIYPWTGHSTLMGHQSRPFQNTSDVLARFARSRSRAVTMYRAFIEAGIGAQSDLVETIRASNNETESIRHTGCWVIGNNEFVKSVVERDRQRRILIAEHAKQGVNVGDIAGKVAKHFGLPVEELSCKGRNNSRSTARKALAYLAHRRLGISVAEIARYFGIRSPSVSYMLRDGESAAKGVVY
jgi:REP element-mobilizing transposase RayT